MQNRIWLTILMAVISMPAHSSKSVEDCEDELGIESNNRQLVANCLLTSMDGTTVPPSLQAQQRPPTPTPTPSPASVLLEACNAINEKDQRLACFKELSVLRNPTTSDAPMSKASSERVKNAFASVAGVVNSGVSLNNYSALILEPAKELEIFKRMTPKQNQQAIDQFDEALVAYRDAEKVWHASIFDSSDGGLFLGRILNPKFTGLQGIVDKYGLPTKQILLTEHLSAEIALPIIWRYAGRHAKAANDALENKTP